MDKSDVKTDANNGEEEGGENNMNNAERSINISNMTISPDKVEASDTLNASQNEDNKPSYVENEGHKERTETSNMTNVSDTTKTDLLNDNNQDVATSELTTKADDEKSIQTLNKNMSNEEVGVKNKNDAENDTKSKPIEDNEQILNEDNKFKGKDDQQNIYNSKMELKDGAQSNVKDKDGEDDN